MYAATPFWAFFWKMFLLHWFTKLTHQTLYREKIIGEVFWRQWRTIIAVPVFMTFSFFFLLLSLWLCWCSSCHYYWSWFDCRCYCCHFCSTVVVNTLLFCSIWHLLCIIMFSVLSRLFLCHCCFCCFVVAVFSLSLLMLLLLHVVFCCCCRCCCMGVVVFIVIGVRVFVVVTVAVVLLLPVLHHCFVLFYGFLISLSLSSH